MSLTKQSLILVTWKERWSAFSLASRCGGCRRWYVSSRDAQDQDKICPNFLSPFFRAVRSGHCQDRCQKLYLRIPSAPPHRTAVCLTGLTSCAVHLGSVVCFSSHFFLSSDFSNHCNNYCNFFALFGRWLVFFFFWIATKEMIKKQNKTKLAVCVYLDR